MKYTQSQLYRNELRNISDVLELINYRPRTIDSYLQSIFECCSWLDTTYGISLNDAQIEHLRSFLLHLKRSKENGGLGYAPRSVNIYNCALKKYFRFVLRRPLSENDLPLCKVDHPLPKVPSKKDVMHLILDTKNLKHQAELAVAYGAALRLLYSFEMSDPHKVPNLRTINTINLEQIANTPTAAYEQFLYGWIEAGKDVPSPMDALILEPKRLFKLIKGRGK